MSKTGIQSGGAVISDLAQLCDRHPISHKLYGLALNTGIASFIKQRSPSTTLVVRNIGRGLDYGWDGDIVAKANAVADAHIAALSPFLPYDPWCETHNEPPTWDDDRSLAENIERAKRGNEWQVIVAGRMHAAGFRHVLAYSFSVGTPRLDFWPHYQDGIAACDGLALHEYWKEGVTPPLPQPGLTFRYRDAYAAMRTKRPIMLTELGYGFLSGYQAHTDMAGYLAMLDTYDAEMAKDAYLACAHIFLCSADSGQWATWDVQQDSEYESRFIPWVKPGVVNVVLPPVDPPTGGSMTIEQERIKAATNSIGRGVNANGIVYVPAFAFPQFAAGLKLGPPLGEEYRYLNSGFPIQRAGQAFRDAIVECGDNDFANIKAYNWGDGKDYSPTIPPVIPPTNPQTCPAVIAVNGAVCELISPPRKFVLAGASVKQGVSAFCVVTVIGKNGVPAVGVRVVNIFKDSTNGEVVQTDGSGAARFQFGASSASSVAGQGPFTFAVSLDGWKDTDAQPPILHAGTIISDLVHSVSDWQGQHTEWAIQFVEV